MYNISEMGRFSNFKHLFTLLSLLIVCVDTSLTANIPVSGSSKQADQRISDNVAQNVLNFGHNLGMKLAALDPYATRSEIFSPLSVMAALSLLTLGAKGKSYQELKQILGLDSDSDISVNPSKYHQELALMLDDLQHTNGNTGDASYRPNANWRFTKSKPSIRLSGLADYPKEEHIIKVANGIFVQHGYTLNPDYKFVIQSMYKTQLQEMDFRTHSREAAEDINAWVKKATFGKIKQLINGDIDPSTNIILASALYFKAVWETTFLQSTAEANFYPDGVENPPIRVQMMNNAGVFPFYDAKEYDCSIMGLPYNGNETTMYIIQPNNSSRRKLRELQNFLDASKINSMIDKMERKTMMLVFPKMHFARRLHLKQIMQAMNVNDLFVNGVSDLSLIGKGAQALFNAPESTPETNPVSFDLIYRNQPAYHTPIVFASRFGVSNNTTNGAEYTDATNSLNKRQTRQVAYDPVSLALRSLESSRQKVDSNRGNLYVDDIIHSVDFSIDERGTEAAAVTSAILLRTGPELFFRGTTPFLILIRHDPTKLLLFYGIINKPEL